MTNTRTLDFETEQNKGMVDRAKEKAQELGENAAEKIDETRRSTAGALETAAGKMHETADAGAQKLSSAMHSAAEGVQNTATYLRDHDARQMMGDVENVVRKHPGQSLLVAAAVGFLVGRAFRND